MNLEQLRADGLILLEAISGSQSQGLATPDSDTDIKGVFALPSSDKFIFRDYLLP